MSDLVTLADFRTAIKTRGGYEGSADVTSAVLDDTINEAIKELYDLLVKKFDDRYTVLSNNLVFVGDITGTGDSLAVASGIVTLTDAASALRTDIVNSRIAIAAASNAANIGTFRILSRPSATTLTFENVRGVAETSSFTWAIDGSGGLALPTDFYGLRKVEILISGDRWTKLYPHDLDAAHRYTNPPTGKGYRYRMAVNNIALDPDPGTTSETIRIYYTPKCPTLTLTTDSFDAINGYGELVVQLALRMIKGDREDLDTSSIERQIERLSQRVRVSADGRDAEPFYLDPNGPRGDEMDEDAEWWP